MTGAPPTRATTTEELARALGRVLGGRPEAVTILARRPIPYRSTFPLEELVVSMADGYEERLVFKDLGGNGDGDPARRVKAPFLHDPLREIVTYRDVLGPHELSAPRYRAAVIDGERNRHWLFLEHIDGDPLWQRGEDEIWEAAAVWAATLHTHFAERHEGLPRSLLVHGGDYYRGWLQRARDFIDWPARAGGRARDFAWLERRASQAIEWLAEQPMTFVHGEFYPSNILVSHAATLAGNSPHETPVAAGRPGMRIRPVDWEMAGIGPGLLDLAALTSGVWSEMDRERMMRAYRLTLPSELRPAAEELRQGLLRCRLLLAVQWLGWSSGWTPPAEHAHDWLTTALELAAEVPA